ncbi:MAG: DUF4231 domain-containing protein [bacterium]|nr:DUF4231 domain-containing protein [bacterium]
MNAEDYIKERLDTQSDWYDRKSLSNQQWYKRLRIVEILLASSIPFLVGYISDARPWMKFAVGTAGVVIAVITGILALHQFQENWINYRIICESLRHHKYRFLAKADPYSGDEALHTFVDNIEALISKQNTNWAEYIKPKSKEEKYG